MSRASYAELGDACATAHAMELIGGRWTYPILRELMLGPKRFTELLASVRGITPAVLSARLRELAATGLVEATPAVGGLPRAYLLTPWAARLAPILRDLGRWAQDSPVHEPIGGLTPDGVVQAMLTMATPQPDRIAGHIELVLRDDRVPGDRDHPFVVGWGRRGVRARRGTGRGRLTQVRSDSTSWGRVLFAGMPLRASGAQIIGSEPDVRALLDCFS